MRESRAAIVLQRAKQRNGVDLITGSVQEAPAIIVLLVSVTIAGPTTPSLLIPPPATTAELPLKVLLITASVDPPGPPPKKFSTPPPAALAEFSLSMQLFTVTVAVPLELSL
jgi:peptidoglycan/LPS O-acetylase OafA/YrhL